MDCSQEVIKSFHDDDHAMDAQYDNMEEDDKDDEDDEDGDNDAAPGN